MVGYTPSLSTAVWVGTTEGTKPLVNTSGGPVYGSGLPSDIWKATMDGALEGHRQRDVPEADGDRRLRRCAAGAAARRRPRHRSPAPPSETVDSADASRWRRASRFRSGRRRRCPPRRRRRQPPGDPGAPRRRPRRPRDASRAALRRRDGRVALSHRPAGAVSPLRRRATCGARRPRPAEPHRLDRRGAVGGDRRTGRPARADRPAAVLDAAAGDAGHRGGVPRVGLLDEGGVPADRPVPGPPTSGWPTGRTSGPTTSCATPTPCRCTPRNC